MTEQLDQIKKGGEKKEEEKITTYADGKDIYHIGDIVYIESQRPDMPYFICSIRDFKRSKKDNITVDVTWYYRPCEIPTSVYQLLLQDRNAEFGSSDHVLDNPIVKNRELFISDAIDVYPAHALRGHATCSAFSEIKENVVQYIEGDDNWFYILRYNPESRRMANAKGEIRIGVSHQACLPSYIPYYERSASDLKHLHEYLPEDLIWDPSIPSSKLTVYLRAACSITSYSDYCESQDGVTENNNTASQDSILQHSYDTLHINTYNISEALQELIRRPVPEVKSQPFTDDERKKFMRGLRSYGKTFHKIRKELLPDRTTAELIHYYYIWKKTSTAISSRPHKRGGRRNNVLARKTRTSKPKTAEASEFLDLSSCSENEFIDSEDSENTKDTSLYACRHCYTSESSNWHHAGKPKMLLCESCRLHFKRYGHMKPLKAEEKREPPPFIYKAAFENLEDDATSSPGRMRTRRSATPVFTNNRTRQLSEGKNGNRKQVTTSALPEQTSDKEEQQNGQSDGAMGAKRKGRNSDDVPQDTKKMKVGRNESEGAEDADDESEIENDFSNRPNENIPQAVMESSTTSFSINELNARAMEENSHQDKPAMLRQAVINTHMEIHKEETHEEGIFNNILSSPPSSPDVPENIELNKKIAERFKHYETQPCNSCSRCERVFVFKRPKKQRQPDIEMYRRREEMPREREYEKRHEGSPPAHHQPAQITSYYESMRMWHQETAACDQRFWPNHQQLPLEMHGARSISPRAYAANSKYNQMLSLERQTPDSHGRVAHTPHSLHGLQTPHHAGLFTTPRPSETVRDYRIPTSSVRPHINNSHPASTDSLSRLPTEGYLRGPSGPEGISRVPSIDRPLIDPSTGLPHIQPHLHSHLHTHTHLHVHPDDKYRHPEAPHYERERVMHPAKQPSPIPHRTASRNSEYHELMLKQYGDIRSHLLIDPHSRDSHYRHVPPPNAREHHHLQTATPVPPEGPVSPNHHEISDPVQYHLWLQHMQHRLPQNGTVQHASAPDLSPHGIPLQRHPHEVRSDHEKHFSEKIMQAHVEREKLSRAVPGDHIAHDHLRPISHEKLHFSYEKHFQHDKHFRHMQHLREERLEPMKMKPDLSLTDRHVSATFRSELHPGYGSHSHFMDSLRAHHDVRSVAVLERSMHERFTQDRLERHAGHDRIFSDRAHHDRPSIFSHHKSRGETIDLSEE